MHPSAGNSSRSASTHPTFRTHYTTTTDKVVTATIPCEASDRCVFGNTYLTSASIYIDSLAEACSTIGGVPFDPEWKLHLIALFESPNSAKRLDENEKQQIDADLLRDWPQWMNGFDGIEAAKSRLPDYLRRAINYNNPIAPSLDFAAVSRRRWVRPGRDPEKEAITRQAWVAIQLYSRIDEMGRMLGVELVPEVLRQEW